MDDLKKTDWILKKSFYNQTGTGKKIAISILETGFDDWWIKKLLTEKVKINKCLAEI